MKDLTIVITTYNRKAELVELLKTLETQGLFDKYYIEIVDNCSNYDVRENLKSSFPNDFMSIINVNKNPINVGGMLNIALSFTHCKTKWMWLLSDDDWVAQDSLSTVLHDIHTYKDVGHIKYSIEGWKRHDDIIVNTLYDFFNRYIEENISVGDLFFMSTCIYNMDVMSNYMEKVPSTAFTYIPHLTPIICSLKNRNAPVRFSSKELVKTRSNNTSFSTLFANLFFYDTTWFLDFDRESRKAFLKIVKQGTRQFRGFLLRNIDDYRKREFYFKRFFNQYYKIYMPQDFIYWLSFKVMSKLSKDTRVKILNKKQALVVS